jgi:hypothetical protein
MIKDTFFYDSAVGLPGRDMDILIGHVRPLTCLSPDGTPYKRMEATESEIASTVCLPHSEWIVRSPKLRPEALVYLIRDVHGKDDEVFGELNGELSKRINRLAGGWVLGLDAGATGQILDNVQDQIFALVLAPKATRQTEFLEIAFGQAVVRRTINAVEKYENSMWGRIGDFVIRRSYDGDEIENPLEECVAGDGPDPEVVCLDKEDKTQLRKLFRKARDKVKNPLHWELARLRYCEEWPIESGDPSVPDLVGYCGGVKRRKVTNMIETAMRQMRIALGAPLKREKGENE